MSQTSPNIDIWPGSGSFYPMTFTPFGFYDNDPEFQCDAEAIAKWSALRLGFPITDIELQEINFYAAFEEAINEYGAQVNAYAARDNLVNLQGMSTGSVNLAQKYIPSTLKGIFKLAKAYGSEVGSGGTLTYYTGSIQLLESKQVYNFVTDASIETGSFATDQFTIRKIFHEGAPALTKYLDPSLGTGLGTQQIMEQFGWGGYTVPGNYLLMPLHYDLLRIQAIEFNNEIRRSAYSFQLTGNRLRIFPIPNQNLKLFFTYTLDEEGTAIDLNNADSITGKISDISNIPYQTMTYRYINEIGKQWIRKYTLAIVKEMLGYVRSKYSSLPIPDGEITLNGADLVSAGKEEMQNLVTELKELLDSMSVQSQLERKAAIAENLANQLKYVPLKIYIR